MMSLSPLAAHAELVEALSFFYANRQQNQSFDKHVLSEPKG
jgi:hypothetical protein